MSYHLFYYPHIHDDLVHLEFSTLEEVYQYIDAVCDQKGFDVEALIRGQELELSEEQQVIRWRVKK